LLEQETPAGAYHAIAMPSRGRRNPSGAVGSESDRKQLRSVLSSCEVVSTEVGRIEARDTWN